MISSAKFALFFEISKSVFLNGNYSKVRNSLVSRTLWYIVTFINNIRICKFVITCVLAACEICAHAINLVQLYFAIAPNIAKIKHLDKAC